MPQRRQFNPDDLIRLLAAIVIAGLLGFGPESYRKFAGLRTIVLIYVGAAFFTILSLKIGTELTKGSEV